MRGRAGLIAPALFALVAGMSVLLAPPGGSAPSSISEEAAAGSETAHGISLGPVSYNGKLAPLVRAAQERAALPVLGLNQWSSLGPNPADAASTAPGYSITGRVNALAYDKVKNHLYLGSEGGVWGRYLSNSAFAWVPLTDTMPSLAVSSLAVDPSHGDVVYAGTGEVSNYTAVGQDLTGASKNVTGVGVYKSTDGGVHWQLYGSSFFAGKTIMALAVDPTDSSLVYAAVSSPLGDYGGSGGGVALSTNAGATWQMVTSSRTSITDLAIDAFGDVYAAVSQKAKANRVFFCTKPPQNGCRAFTPVSSGLPGATAGAVKIALDPHTAGQVPSSQVLYAVMTDATQTGHLDQLLGVYRTANGGHTWTQVANYHSVQPAPANPQGHYDLTVAVSPSDATGNTVYLGVVDLFVSHDASSTSSHWTQLSAGANGVPNGIHVDQHAVAFVGSTLYAGNDGGVYTSSNGGGAFSGYNQSLAISQFYGGSVGTTNTKLIVGGTQDNGFLESTGSGWASVIAGDDFYAAIDPTDNTVSYGESFRAHTFSLDGAFDVTPTYNGSEDGALFWAPLIMHPDNNAELISGRNHVWISTDKESHWTQQASPVSTSGISALAAPREPNGRLYITDRSGNVWLQDGPAASPTITQQPPPGLLPGQWITGLATDPLNSQIVYATANGVNGSQVDHVLRSNNAGKSWKDISTTLPDTPFYSIVVSPLTPGTIYAGGLLGVYVSRDAGGTWYQLGTGLPNVPAWQLALNSSGTELTAFTFGRGVWRYKLADGTGLAYGSFGTGQLGDGRSGCPSGGCWQSTPIPIPNLSDVAAFAAGNNNGATWGHSLALKKDGTVLAWGSNDYGQTGIGGVRPAQWTSDGCPCVLTPTPVVDKDGNPLTGVVSIAAKANVSYALRNDGTVWAWGYNHDGELGTGTADNSNYPCYCTPYAAPVPGATGVVAIAAGGQNVGDVFAVALKSDGTLIAWGRNDLGQIGTGSATADLSKDPNHCYCIPSPTPVNNLTDVVSVSGGAAQVLALRSDGTVWGWGSNVSCSLTNITQCNTSGSVPLVLTPTQLGGLAGISQVVAYDRTGFALKKNGTILAWGYNGFGELGRGTVYSYSDSRPCECEATPAPVLGGQDAVAVAGGAGYNIFALQRDGTVMFWSNTSPTPQTWEGLNLVRGIWTSFANLLVLK